MNANDIAPMKNNDMVIAMPTMNRGPRGIIPACLCIFRFSGNFNCFMFFWRGILFEDRCPGSAVPRGCRIDVVNERSDDADDGARIRPVVERKE